ncbi:MAG: ATP-binding cassette domain-containing protein [Burkholderiales bacterium]|nr:ATP-binding cassette domain-containing protein [Burkholderiales bacterium]
MPLAGDDVILQAQGLTKEFKGFLAVSDVDLSIRRGSIHALIGPNGAGKTIVFNLLSQFLRPTRGRIVYAGRDISAASPAQIARMGMVRSFQISAVSAHLSVRDNVRVALQRGRGGSFDFWRSERALRVIREHAMAPVLGDGVPGETGCWREARVALHRRAYA